MWAQSCCLVVSFSLMSAWVVFLESTGGNSLPVLFKLRSALLCFFWGVVSQENYHNQD